MRKEFEPYYRTDVEEQKTAGRNVRFFTEAGYERLNALIAQIKQGGAESDQAGQDFADMIDPWARRVADHYAKKKVVELNVDRIIARSVAQIRKNPRIVDWCSFSQMFGKVKSREAIDMYRRAKVETARAERRHAAETLYAAGNHEAVDDNPAVALETRERQQAIRDVVDELPSEQQELLMLRARVERPGLGSTGTEWASPVATATGINRTTVKSRMYKLRQELHRKASGNSALADWLDGQRIAPDHFSDINDGQESGVEAQKAIIRGIFFPTPEDKRPLQEMANDIGVSAGVMSFFLGNSRQFKQCGALSDYTRDRLTVWLEANSRGDKVEDFQTAFDRLRELTDHQARNLGHHKERGAAR